MADLERRNMKLGFLLIDLNDPAKIAVQKKKRDESRNSDSAQEGIEDMRGGSRRPTETMGSYN
jgi:hypothetical protein